MSTERRVKELLNTGGPGLGDYVVAMTSNHESAQEDKVKARSKAIK